MSWWSHQIEAVTTLRRAILESSGPRNFLCVQPLRYGSCLLLQHWLSLSLLIHRERPEVEGNVSNLESTTKERKLDSEDWCDGSHTFVFLLMK